MLPFSVFNGRALWLAEKVSKQAAIMISRLTDGADGLGNLAHSPAQNTRNGINLGIEHDWSDNQAAFMFYTVIEII